ncbi:MAG: chromosome partitioning protein ParB [Sulfurovum sp. FS06-10]|jgi:ParB family chromosome partitioning protein|nr:MAG: chromosome partitioning protein ParB [Sulfurovum sp. FS06-10]
MALGRGLGAILEEVGQAYESEMGFSRASNDQIREILVSDITPNPYQPRKHFDQEALIELSESIKRHGLLQPIIVIDKGDSYLLVAGERRLKAHELAKISTIKAIVADVDIDDGKLRELALIENIQRENLNAVELAHSYDELIKVYSITHDELSNVVHKSRSQITNTLRLLALSDYVQSKLIYGLISQGHAKILVGFNEAEQKLLVDTIIGQKLSVRETESLAKNKKMQSVKNIATKDEEIFMESYKNNLTKKLPFTFKVKKNRLEIHFKNDSEIQNFLNMLPK